MNRVSGLLLGLLLVAWAPGRVRVWGAAPREDERSWRKLVTANFQLYSNAREAEGQRLLRELEVYRHFVSRFLGLTNVQREPALVFLFDGERSFTPYKPRYEGKPRAVSGFHVADPLGTALALSRQGRGDETMRVLFHEYTHLLTSRQYRDVPVWAHEGMAEVFSTFESQGDHYEIGVAVTNHVRFLQRGKLFPVAGLLGVDRESADYNERNRAGRFYATSWLLAHRLLFGLRGYETNVMARYATLCSSTTNQSQAFWLAFGRPPAEFDADLAEYLQGGRYTIVQQTEPDLEEARPVAMRLESGELDYAMGRLLQLTQQEAAARARFDEAVHRAPGDPRPRAALALMAWRGHDLDEGKQLAGDAIALGSESAFLHYLEAEIRYQQIMVRVHRGEPQEAALSRGRARCERALALDPELAPAHHLLAVYTLAQNPRSPALAMQHVLRALRCDPQYQPAQLTRATLLAAQGELVAARQSISRLLAGPLSPELRESAQAVSDQIDRLMKKTKGSVLDNDK